MDITSANKEEDKPTVIPCCMIKDEAITNAESGPTCKYMWMQQEGLSSFIKVELKEENAIQFPPGSIFALRSIGEERHCCNDFIKYYFIRVKF